MSRLLAHSENYGAELLVDINTQLYPMGLNQRFAFALATTIREDGAPDDGEEVGMDFSGINF